MLRARHMHQHPICYPPLCFPPHMHTLTCIFPHTLAVAGYGRKEAAEQLLDAGATPAPLNQKGQTPSDAAKQNRENHMVSFLKSRSKTEADTGFL